MPSEKHKQLTKIGENWLKKNGFPVTHSELRSHFSREEPDVIGFSSKSSIIIEIKVSRSDFFADQKKPERKSGGLGVYRFYMTPKDLLAPEEIPEKWGLLEVEGRKVIETIKPTGNYWPGIDAPDHIKKQWKDFQHQPDNKAERSALYSIARRLSTKK